MSGTHGVFQHRPGYFYTMLEEDFCEVYKADGKNEVCRAYITSILEHLTNKQYEATGSDADIWVFMSLPEMSRRMRHAFGERTIHKEIQGMIADGYLFKRRAYGKATMEYRLNLRKLRKALEALPEKQPCNNATYHLANLQDQSSIIARSTLQNYKNDLAELQPRITIEETLEETKNKEREGANAPTRTNETSYHIAGDAIRNDVEEDTPTVHRMPAIRLNGASHAPMVGNLPADRDSASVVSRSGVSGSHGIQQPGRPERHAEVPADTQGDRQAITALQVQQETREITSEQTPGPGALPSSAAVADTVGRSDGITRDQAQPSLLLDPEPAQSSPPTGSVASDATRTAQATGKPEKQEAKETAKQKKARLERRRDEIIALHCQLLGRNVVRSKDELEGARLMAEAGSTDAEITITYQRYKKDKFWGHQLTLKNIAKLLDTTVANDTSVPATTKPRARPKPEDRNISIYEIDPSWQVWQRPGDDQEWIWWQGEFWTPDEADDRGYNGGGGLYIQTQYAQGV